MTNHTPNIGGLPLEKAREVAQAAPPAFDLDVIRKRVKGARASARRGRNSRLYRVHADRADLLTEVERLRTELAEAARLRDEAVATAAALRGGLLSCIVYYPGEPPDEDGEGRGAFLLCHLCGEAVYVVDDDGEDLPEGEARRLWPLGKHDSSGCPVERALTNDAGRTLFAERAALLDALWSIFWQEGGADCGLSAYERAFELLERIDPNGWVQAQTDLAEMRRQESGR